MLREFVPDALKPGLRYGRDLAIAGVLPIMERSNAADFASEVIRNIAAKRKAVVASPTWDRMRFPQGEPKFSPLAAYKVLSFIRRNADDLNQAARLLADLQSRRLLSDILAFRALGPRHVTLQLDLELKAKVEAAQATTTGSSDTDFPPFAFARHAVEFEGSEINLECWTINVYGTFVERQYYFERNGVTIRPQPGDVVIDAGGCFGDTALAFASSVGQTGHVYVFEPIPRQRHILAGNVKRNPSIGSRITVSDRAVSDTSDVDVTFTDGGAGARQTKAGQVAAKTISIDAFVARHSVPKVDFIKMDIEGAETSALQGAAETIRNHRPKLAISIYHSLGELVSIPILVHSLLPGYRLFVDHHTAHSEETILYATPAKVRSP